MALVLTVASDGDAKSPGNNTDTRTLHLLTLLPGRFGTDLTAPAERGRELLPAAQLAVDRINAREDLLQGITLKLFPADADRCEDITGTDALVSYIRYVSPQSSLNVVGILGLTCTAVTELVSPITSLPAANDSFLNVVQVSVGGTSPRLDDAATYPNLYRMISSTAAYNAAVLALMRFFDWKRISLIRDTVDAQNTGTAADFEDEISAIEEFQLLLRGEITEDVQILPVLRELRNHESRIIYASVPGRVAQQLLCAAFEENVISPGFVWIFHDLSLDDFMPQVGEESCSGKELWEALNGALLLSYRLEPENKDQPLVSGQTYRDFRQEYNLRTNHSDNLYANAMHDSVWAFALALNEVDLATVQLYNSAQLAGAIRENLRDVNFNGTVGHVQLNSSHQAARTKIDVFQVRDNNLSLVAVYNPYSESLEEVDVSTEMPPDTFDHMDEHIHRSLPILTFIFTSILMVIATVVLVLYLVYWRDPVIKATSPILGLVILSGCYALYVTTLFVASREYASGDAFAFLCNAEIWLITVGIQLIFATLLVRLLRVYRIFFLKKEQKIGKLWSDYFLLLAIAVMVSILLFLLILWSSIHPFTTGEDVDFHSTSSPPHYTKSLECSSNGASGWITTMFLYNCLTIVSVLVLAIKTRKIELDMFKDTKKVSAFVYSTFMVLLTCAPLAAIFVATDIPEAAFMFRILTYLLIATLCIIFLFLSKIISAIFGLEEPRSKSTSRGQTTAPSPRTPRRPSTGALNEPATSNRKFSVMSPKDRKGSIHWPVHDDTEDEDEEGFRIFDLTVGDILDYCSCCGREQVVESPA